jgi:hypothetical protein
VHCPLGGHERLAAPFRRIGSYTCTIQFEKELKADISIDVAADRTLESAEEAKKAEEAAEAPTVRGRCDGCRRNVLSNDEGRQREGDKYYHSKCVKGLCGGCGLIVHIDAGRVKRDRVYWHADCANP